MSIGEKLIKVMTACRYMTKDGRNDFQKYDYTTAASIFGKINEAMTEQKLYVSTKFELVESRDVTTAKGNTEKFVAMKVTITVHDAEDTKEPILAEGYRLPKETVTFEGYGSGQDAGDKAIMKANTAALKYAYIGGLCISMGDDPEEDTGTNAYQPSTRQQQTKPTNNPPPRQSNMAPSELKCRQCGKPITQAEASYSMNKYGKHLCRDCQKGAQR